MAVKVVELCQVPPSAAAAAAGCQTLPLTNFDIVRLGNHLLHYLFFYTFECSQFHFLHDVVPKLKQSLSLTLDHFLPLSGKIVLPLASGTPFSHYSAGEDAVSVRIAVSDAVFRHVTGRDCAGVDKYGDLVPLQLLSVSCSDSIGFSCMAVQVTLFPNEGICIGQTFHHAIADGNSILGFQQTWASIHTRDAHYQSFLPFYGRSVVDDLATRAWSHSKTSMPTVSSTFSSSAVRARFILSGHEIQTLRNFAHSKKPASTPHISSLVAVLGLVWSCFAKSATAAGEEVGDDEVEYLTCSANCRARSSPPLPHAYFGNCVVLVLAESTHGTLKGKEGSAAGAFAIEEALCKFLNNKGTTFDDLEIRLKVRGKRVVTVAGSPQYDFYGIDYGWGRPKNFEFPTNDCTVLIIKSKEEGGIEIGLCVPKVKMDAFAGFLSQGIREAKQSLRMNSNL